MSEPVYLDFAATSAIRPPEVADAVHSYLRDVGATPGRAGHRRALDAGRVTLRCRRALAELLGIPGDPGRIVFQLNATHALNTALLGVLRPGDRLVRTQYDHNAVRRPAAALRRIGVQEDVIPVEPDGRLTPGALEAALERGPAPRLLVLTHASNVLGTVLPVAELAARARARGTLVLLDAAQTAGHLPVDVAALGVDLLAAPGHKGLLGPQGTGVLWIREGVEVEPLLRGGTGGDSLPDDMPAVYPDHLEAGTLNGPGIAGLLAGVEWARGRGVEALHARSRALKQALLARLRGVVGLRIRSPDTPEGVGVVLVTADRLPPDRLALRLEREHGVLTRAGLHCAPEAHQALGTRETGAVRLSIGWCTTERDLERAAAALQRLAADGG